MGVCNTLSISHINLLMFILKHLMLWHFLKLANHLFELLKSPSTSSFSARTLACVEIVRLFKETFRWCFYKKENFVRKAYNYVLAVE